MTTTMQHDDADEPGVPNEPVAPEELEVLTYWCAAHATFFPDEEQRRPYKEFRVSPITLERLHDTACLRCVRERRRRQARKRGWDDRPLLVQVQDEIAKCEEELVRQQQGRGNWRLTEAGVRFKLHHLRAQEARLAEAARQQREEDAAE